MIPLGGGSPPTSSEGLQDLLRNIDSNNHQTFVSQRKDAPMVPDSAVSSTPKDLDE